MHRPLALPAAALVVVGSLALVSRPALAADPAGPKLRIPISEAELREDVGFLAGDLLGGRASGEPGLEVAAEYLAGRFQELGLEPAGDGGGFYNWFEVSRGADFAARSGVTVRWQAGGERTLGAWTEAFPLGFGDTADEVDAPVVFAGFGVSASAEERQKGIEYDDYAGIDIEGKVVVLLRFVPRGEDEPLGGARSPHAPIAAKLAAARKRGAAGVILVTPPGHPQTGAEVESIENMQGYARLSAPRHPTLPAVLVPSSVGDELLASAGKNVRGVATEIDRSISPQSFELPGVTVRFATRRGRLLLRNVAARLPGAGELTDETVVVGAHYDHIGRHDAQVKRPNFGEIHNGADDNASGTAGVLALARVFAEGASDLGPDRRAVVFLGFSGEEIGLLGSRHWVSAERRYRVRDSAWLVPTAPTHGAPQHGADSPEGQEPRESSEPTGHRVPPGSIVLATGESAGNAIEVTWPAVGLRGWVPAAAVEQVSGPEALHRIKGMINLDMIGHAKDPARVSVIGADSSKAFGPMLDAAAAGAGIELRRAGGIGGGGSDHASFARRKIPVLFFFTGMHRLYNTPEDDVETVDFAGMQRVLTVARNCLAELVTMPAAPSFNPESSLTRRSPHGGDGPKLGVMLGRPEAGKGARIADVVGETPAARAGIRAGDLIVHFGDRSIGSPRDLIEAVTDAGAGSEVEIRLRRGGEEVRVIAKFPGTKGFRVSFGSVPDYAFEERGVRFEDIRPGTSAAAAGVKPGDVLVKWNGEDVEDVAHWTRFLGKHKPGDVVKIEVRRGEETLQLEAKLKAR